MAERNGYGVKMRNGTDRNGMDMGLKCGTDRNGTDRTGTDMGLKYGPERNGYGVKMRNGYGVKMRNGTERIWG